MLQASSFIATFGTCIAIALGGIDPILGLIAICGFIATFVAESK